MSSHTKYEVARQQLISFLSAQGFKTHSDEVFCPSSEHCWVDVAALKEQDYWAFEYKSRTDSIRRGLEQCSAYAKAFNYVVLVADRYRVTLSPYFSRFMHRGFGVWRHDGTRFYPILRPKRHVVSRNAKVVVERQFRNMQRTFADKSDMPLSAWFELKPNSIINIQGHAV
jgi:Holliday junction resolvase